MKKFVALLYCLISISLMFSQINTFGNEEENEEPEYFFAIKLLPNLNGNLIQVAIKDKKIDEKDDIEYLTISSFARQMAGYESSKANPLGENLIKKYQIFEMPADIENYGDGGIEIYTVEKIESIINNLWRLKYSEYPFFNSEMNSEKGWAKHRDENITWLPSEKQMTILRSYGINELSDFIEGDQVMRLLKDVTNRDWLNIYIKNGGVYNEEILTDTIPKF